MLLSQLVLYWLLVFVISFNSNNGVRASGIQSATTVSSYGVPVTTSSSSLSLRHQDCIVVGGGPVGLAAALTLSSAPYSMNVVVLEKNANDATIFDPTRSYLYGINSHGLQWFHHHHPSNNTTLPVCRSNGVGCNNAFIKLKERATAHVRAGDVRKVVMVPGDPSIPVKLPHAMTISSTVTSRPRSDRFLILRHTFIGLLQECCYEQQQRQQQRQTLLQQQDNRTATTNTHPIGSITLLFGKSVESMEAGTLQSGSRTSTGGDIVTVKCDDGTSYSGALVIGADGIHSAVRQCLAGASSSKELPETTRPWLQSRSEAFLWKRYTSPATGLKMKALLFPPTLRFQNTDGSWITTQSDVTCSFQSIFNGPRRRLLMSVFSVQDTTPPLQIAAMVTRSNHELWNFTTAADCKAWFQRAFPRLPFDEWIDDTEWERYVQAKGITFPHCQYTPGCAVSSPDGQCGVVLLGDACHAFPPDIGEGVNAGLQDVVAFDRALRGLDILTGTSLHPDKQPKTIADAVTAYDQNRQTEHAALIRLTRFGAPYQYQQPWLRDRIGQALWSGNLLGRLFLNKVTLGVFPVAAIQLLIQNPNWSRAKIMKTADTGTLVLQVFGILLLLVMLAIRQMML